MDSYQLQKTAGADLSSLIGPIGCSEQHAFPLKNCGCAAS